MRNNAVCCYFSAQRVVVWCRIGMRNNKLTDSLITNAVVVWCRIGMRNNALRTDLILSIVVVWCRIGMRNNLSTYLQAKYPVVVWCRIGMRNNNRRSAVFRKNWQTGRARMSWGTVEAAVCHCCSGWREHVACGRKMCAGYLCTRCIGIYRYLRILRIIN